MYEPVSIYMSEKSWLKVLILLFLVSPCGCNGCDEEDDETQIRRIIKKGVFLAEKHETGELLDLTTEDFRANPGSRDRRETAAYLMIAFRRFGDFIIRYPAYSVELGSSAGTAEVSLPFVILRNDRKMPGVEEFVDSPVRWMAKAAEVADPYYLNLKFHKKDGEWMVRRAKIKGTGRLDI